MRSELYNGGAFSRSAFVAINKTAVAAGSGDATEVDGAWVAREHEDFGLAMSAKLVITFTTALEQDETLKFAVQFRDATDISGTGAADYGAAVAATVAATGNSGGSTETDTFEVDIDLSGANAFVQAQITPDLSRGATDTAEWSAALVFYGDKNQPSTRAVATIEHP